ncbi:DNA cytosine methyltransferase [Kitasatospora sp. NPDC050463]|uniref:DNA cytosine methyltransferase n=1 Tax=Kitasatospora sp. NPDC050463 TaxID=3155786 RepID=UPI0033D015D3
MNRHIIDLFAGPGGWSEGLRRLGHTDTGFEIDAAACATRVAAGHRTIRTDVAAYPTAPLAGKVSGLIASPPCQTFSTAGLRAGTDDIALCHQALDDLAAGHDTRSILQGACSDHRSLLVVEPLRFALATRPDWVALEEVPAVEPLFDHTARILRSLGYSTWVGVLNAADHGIPQTRRRAFLLASTAKQVAPPESTHARIPEPESLFGPGRAAWVTMADSLTLPAGDVVTRGEHHTGGNRFATTGPAWALTGRSRSWSLRVGNRPSATRRPIDAPAPTLLFGHSLNHVAWHDDDGTPVRRLSIAEASVLQDFSAQYPWTGSRTKQFEQIGNAVPPGLATAVLRSVLEPARFPLAVAA